MVFTTGGGDVPGLNSVIKSVIYRGTEIDKIGNHYLNLVAELKPQATLNQARSEMATILDRILRKYPKYYGGATGLGVSLIPLREQMVGNVRPTMLVLMAGVGFMLLIACTNVASLHLVRGEDRKQEIATRTALGATRWRILYQVLISSDSVSVQIHSEFSTDEA